MTELQMGLIGLGAAAVVGVLAYNKWQEFRHRKVAEQVMKSEHDDVLLDRTAAPERPPAASVGQEDMSWREPSLGGADSTGGASVHQASSLAAAVKNAPSPSDVPDEEPAEAPSGEPSSALLDPRIDFIVVMELVEAVPAAQIFESQYEVLERLSKPVIWIGYNDRQREWENILPDSGKSYRRLRVGLQLADRRGPLSEADLNVFVVAMHELADDLLAVADMSPHQGVIGQAVDIDRFCADVDLEIGVHLISKGTPFSGTKVRALAEAAGMVLGGDGLFTRYDDSGNAQFKLQNYESTAFSPEAIKGMTTHGITFLLDVPRVAYGERVFFLMVDQARRFADALQGQLVDDNRQPLAEAQLDRIKREYVTKTQAKMAQFGLPAGGPQALRLFS